MEMEEKEIPTEPANGEENKDNTPAQPPLLKLTNDIFDVLELFVFCAACVLSLFTFVIRPTVVYGASMEDTLLEGDALLVSPLAGEPECGDIIVAQNTALPLYPEAIVKRVIATEGQIIDIDFTSWTVTIDGVVLEEPYRKLTADYLRTSDWTYPKEIPEGYIFVMGDNRNHSADSRCSDIGLIDKRCVVGKALVRVFPFTRFTVFD